MIRSAVVMDAKPGDVWHAHADQGRGGVEAHEPLVRCVKEPAVRLTCAWLGGGLDSVLAGGPYSSNHCLASSAMSAQPETAEPVTAVSVRWSTLRSCSGCLYLHPTQVVHAHRGFTDCRTPSSQFACRKCMLCKDAEMMATARLRSSTSQV